MTPVRWLVLITLFTFVIFFVMRAILRDRHGNRICKRLKPGKQISGVCLGLAERYTSQIPALFPGEGALARTIALALVVEQLASDRKKAEAILDKARKEAPLDHGVLRALVEVTLKTPSVAS